MERDIFDDMIKRDGMFICIRSEIQQKNSRIQAENDGFKFI